MAELKRSPAMDIIRCFALFTVVSVHFFLNNGYYDTVIDCPRMYIMTAMRTFFMICVPLFLVLSGYLLKNKKPNAKYYAKLFYTIGIYILASIACGTAKFVYNPELYSIFGLAKGIVFFSTASYSWYVEMYIGLFLLIPFLNMMYNGLETQKKKLGLIATFLVLTAFPSFVPDYWIIIYPITYYFIGCYLKDYPINIKTNHLLIYNLLCIVLLGLYNCLRNNGSNFIWGHLSNHESIFTVIQTVLIFSFFANLKYSKIGEKSGKFLAYISKLTLGAYLCSEIFDNIFYKILNSNVTDMHKRLDYYIVIVPTVYICSLALSAVLNFAYDVVAKLCTWLWQKRKVTKKI